MGDYNISIIPARSIFPGKEKKALEIINWLAAENIVSADLSDCILRKASMWHNGWMNGIVKRKKTSNALPAGEKRN